jgi:TolA-binding protein
MRRDRALAAGVLAFGVAACATPGQVRRVQTQVEVLDRERARSDSSRAAELARVQIAERLQIDSLNRTIRALSDNIQQLSRETASGFDNLTRRVYEVANGVNNTQSSVRKLSTQVQTAATSAPPVAPDSGAAGTAAPPTDPDALLVQARTMMDISAFNAARVALNTLMQNFPQSTQMADALFFYGNTFDPAQPDSARVYYTRVYKTYPQALRASTSLYKLGILELKLGNTDAAKGYFQQIVRDYKQSDEFSSAQDRLREIP